jgi:hypothetical protein
MLGFCECAYRCRQCQENRGKVGWVLSIQEIRWSNGDGEGADDLIFFDKRYNNYLRRVAFFVQKGIRVLAAVQGVEVVSDGMSHIVLGGRWCDMYRIHLPQMRVNVNTKEEYYIICP